MNAVEMGIAVRGMTTDLLLGDDNPTEPFIVRMKPQFNTACWSWLPPHTIYIGEKCLGRAKKGLKKPMVLAYLQAFLTHEVSHLRWTDKDLSRINVLLASSGIPFSLWNLFEDARIEHRERQRSGKKFNWNEYENISVPAVGAYGSPIHEFFLLIQLENEHREERMVEVVAFYDQAIQTEASIGLLPLLANWVTRFGTDAPPSGDLQTSQQLQQDSHFRDTFNEGTVLPGMPSPAEPASIKLSAKGRSKLLSKSIEDVNFQRAEQLASKFLALFGSRQVTIRTEEPSARISARHLELERPCYQRKVAVQTIIKRICLVVDCSGSMTGKPIYDAKMLTWALSYLASLGKIHGCLILSAVVGDKAVSEVFDFPVTREIVSRIHAFGDAEGLNAAILLNQAKLQQADMVFVKTDGEICDEPIDKREVQQRGITVCGLYSGGVQQAARMQQHFNRFIARDSLDSLMDALLQSRLV
ncbi:MAG: hypothetical protein Q7U16_12725 [Agitococcus sp.]|nr:hypothetical protein [Agitococcus sp.]